MWSRQQVSMLIAKYKEHPCLYVPKHPLYKNRRVRIKALEEIRSELLKMALDVAISEIKIKFNNLRTNYLAQRRSHMASCKSGMGSEEIYKPALWYYDQLAFVAEHTVPRNLEDSMPTQDAASSTHECHSLSPDVYFECTLEEQTTPIFELDSSLSSDEDDTEHANPAKKMRIADDVATASYSASPAIPATRANNSKLKQKSADDERQNAISVVQTVPKRSSDVFSEFIASQMRYLECDEAVLLETQQEITNIVWAARKKLLHK